MDIAENIMELRRLEGLSQREFGRRLGISGGAVSKWESRDNKITRQRIIGICSIFGVREEWLTTGEGEVYERGYARSDLDRLTRAYDALKPEYREIIVNIADMLLEQGKKL